MDGTAAGFDQVSTSKSEGLSVVRFSRLCRRHKCNIAVNAPSGQRIAAGSVEHRSAALPAERLMALGAPQSPQRPALR